MAGSIAIALGFASSQERSLDPPPAGSGRPVPLRVPDCFAARVLPACPGVCASPDHGGVSDRVLPTQGVFVAAKKTKAKKETVRTVFDTVSLKVYPPPVDPVTGKALPTFVRIHGRRYEVTYASPLLCADDGDLWGRVYFEERRILVDPTRSFALTREILLHEIAHVYCRAWDMPEGGILEKICDVFAEGWADLQENNDL